MRVGTRKGSNRHTVTPEDHPHACGDKAQRQNNIAQLIGSSPCVWGQVLVRYVSVRVVGIIPMRVGTRIDDLYTESEDEDHPHACGDKIA